MPHKRGDGLPSSLRTDTANHAMPTSAFQDQLDAALGPLTYTNGRGPYVNPLYDPKSYKGPNTVSSGSPDTVKIVEKEPSAPCYSTENWTESDGSTKDVPRFWVMTASLKDFDIKGFARKIHKSKSYEETELFCDFKSDATGHILRFYVNVTHVDPFDKGKVNSWDLTGNLADGRICKLSIIKGY
jgi:hypothetical protein